jgi:hypothetical protein
MSLFLISFAIVAVMVLAMSVGVLAGRGPIKGSCGGMSALGIDTECDICGGDPDKCDSSENAAAPGDRFYDATQKRFQALPVAGVADAGSKRDGQ